MQANDSNRSMPIMLREQRPTILIAKEKRTKARHQPFTFKACPELTSTRVSRVPKETPAHVARSIFFISLRRSLIVDVLVRGIASAAGNVAFD